MALADITRAEVLAAIGECDRLGRETFLRVRGYGRARRYVLVYDGNSYDSKAIAGVAHGYLPGKRPLRSADFSGGEDRVARLLRRLGFTVSVPADLTVEELLRAVSGLTVSRAGGHPASHQPIALLWAIGRARRDAPRIVSWRETEQSIRALMERYARTGERPRPDYPVAALFHAGLWELRSFTGQVPPASGDTRLWTWFDTNQPDGGLAESVDDLIRQSALTRAQVTALITDSYLGDLDCNDLLADVGLSDEQVADDLTAGSKDEAGRAAKADGPAIWTNTENQSVVEAYFTMLRAEIAGQPYVKADINREVQASTGRSRGSVEYKFANISAVLGDIGLPHVLGYEPRGNYQHALRTEVEEFLVCDPEFPRLLEEMPAPDLPSVVQLVEVDPPATAPPRLGGHGQTSVGVDYMERHARNRDIGLKGELLVVEHERAWLEACGRPDLAELVAHVPSTLGDGAGYDVRSFLPDGSPHHIEVKTTPGSITAPFFLSAGELRHALKHPGTYSIYRIFDLGPNPRFYKLTGAMEEVLDLTPVSYQARVRSPYRTPCKAGDR